MHSPAFAVLWHPVPVFFLYYLSMYAFFLTPLLGYAMAHMWLMDVINLIFLFGAALFWGPMVGGDPIPGGPMHPGLKIVNLLVGVGPGLMPGLLAASTRVSTPVPSRRRTSKASDWRPTCDPCAEMDNASVSRTKVSTRG